MKIVFVGDLFLGGDLTGKDLKSCINVQKFHDANYRIVNLEHPISDRGGTADKSVLFTGTDVLISLQNSGVNAVNLANNHIHDKLDAGIIDTVNNLNKFNIPFFGAGRNLKEAKKPLWINKEFCVLGYCQFESPTLNNIKIATNEIPGVSPLTLTGILKDLDLLPKGSKAILYFHWGREHVWLTQHKNIRLAKELLKNDKVALILGTHPHRVQGYICDSKKKAFFSLGNFLFPNFLIKPRIEVINEVLNQELVEKLDTTRQYHSVSKKTYKKWRFVNRVSQLIEYDTETQEAESIFICQEDNSPIVKELKGFGLVLFIYFTNYLNFLYTLPKNIYIPMEKFFSQLRFSLWRIQIVLFKIKQLGVINSLKKRFSN